jgi:hypothetical protein
MMFDCVTVDLLRISVVVDVPIPLITFLPDLIRCCHLRPDTRRCSSLFAPDFTFALSVMMFYVVLHSFRCTSSFSRTRTVLFTTPRLLYPHLVCSLSAVAFCTFALHLYILLVVRWYCRYTGRVPPAPVYVGMIVVPRHSCCSSSVPVFGPDTITDAYGCLPLFICGVAHLCSCAYVYGRSVSCDCVALHRRSWVSCRAPLFVTLLCCPPFAQR